MKSFCHILLVAIDNPFQYCLGVLKVSPVNMGLYSVGNTALMWLIICSACQHVSSFPPTPPTPTPSRADRGFSSILNDSLHKHIKEETSDLSILLDFGAHHPYGQLVPC